MLANSHRFLNEPCSDTHFRSRKGYCTRLTQSATNVTSSGTRIFYIIVCATDAISSGTRIFYIIVSATHATSSGTCTFYIIVCATHVTSSGTRIFYTIVCVTQTLYIIEKSL